MHSPRLVGVVLVALSAVCFGALGVLAEVAYDDGAEPVAVLAVRFGAAAVVFIALRALRPAPRPGRGALLGLVAMGVGYFVQSLCFFTAVQHAPPGLVTLLLYTFPVLVVAFGALTLGIPVTRRVTAACGVALAGTVLIVGPSARGGEPLGVVFGLGAAVVYALYILLGSRVLRAVEPLWASTVVMTTAALAFGAIVLVSSPRPALPRGADGWAAMAGIALVCTVVAGLAFLAGLARVGPADASTISTIEPVVSVALSAVVLGEAVTGWTLAGGTLIVAAVVAISRSPAAPELAEPAPAA